MGKQIAYMIILLFSLIDHITSAPQSTTSRNLTQKPVQETQNSNKTIAELVQQQTDTIKKIVLNHQQQSRLDYPVVTKSESQKLRDDAKKEIEQLTLEELKIRCQHLSKLLNANNTNEKIDDIPTNSNHRPFFQRRPVYVPPKPLYGTRYTSATQRTNGFYITTQPPTTKKPQVTQPSLPQGVKYIRLEPVILQKTILSDGRIVYYWHRNLPSAIQYPDQSGATTQTVESSTMQYEKQVPTTSTTPATTSYNRYYDFRNFLPFYGYSSQEVSTSTEKSTTSTTTSIPEKPSTDKPELLYSNQLRFVVPVPYENPDRANLNNPWEFDQFAYYPKELQPSTINVQVPYSPSFHMIKTLALPNNNAENVENIDDVEQI